MCRFTGLQRKVSRLRTPVGANHRLATRLAFPRGLHASEPSFAGENSGLRDPWQGYCLTRFIGNYGTAHRPDQFLPMKILNRDRVDFLVIDDDPPLVTRFLAAYLKQKEDIPARR